ncbi:MAG: class I SAM-dependent methyltransferase [Clostridia bacterium]|nr:class I SAM-dependent methyltransferase [Clostridia bacterium]
MYTDFAAVYDRLMQDVDYDAWADYYAAMMQKNGVPRGGTVCECACGTGSLTVRLQAAGYRMTGIDLSREMLSVAQQKARGNGQMIPFVQQDMTSLRLHKRQDAVLCTCDGLNYLLTPERVRRFFRAAYAALKPGGLLAFDLSTPDKLRGTLGNHTLGSREEETAYVWQNTWNERSRTVSMALSIFVREQDGRYVRLEEEQTQRAHTMEELKSYLEDAGFAHVRFYGDRTMRAPAAGTSRWHGTAVRPKE